MFIVTARAPRRRSLLVGALAVFALLAALLLFKNARTEQAEAEPLLLTNEQRVAWLESLGWAVVPEPVEVLRTTLPDELVEPYRSYNELQLRQGYDLTPYLGQTLERCTYTVTNHPSHPGPCQADLFLSDGVIVAGDVICTGENGFIAPLDFPEPQNAPQDLAPADAK